MARDEGVAIVLNARIDVFLQAYATSGKPDERVLLGAALRRARAYLDAGADCVYPILARSIRSWRASPTRSRGSWPGWADVR